MTAYKEETICQTVHMLYKATPNPVKAGLLVAIPVALGLGFGFGFFVGNAPVPRISVEYTVPPNLRVRKELYAPKKLNRQYVEELTQRLDQGTVTDLRIKSVY